MASLPCRRRLTSSAIIPRVRRPALIQSQILHQEPVKFDAAFIERRMRQHQEWQRLEEQKQLAIQIRDVLAIVDELSPLVEESHELAD